MRLLACLHTHIHTCTLVLRIQINQAIHPFAAAALLRHCSWNKEQVIDSFCTDMDKVRDERNGSTDGRTEQDWIFLTHPTTHQAKEAAGIARFVLELQPGSKAQVCGICREEVAASKLVAIGCGHSFCRPCYTAYLCSKVRRCDAMRCDARDNIPGIPRAACLSCLPACLPVHLPCHDAHSLFRLHEYLMVQVDEGVGCPLTRCPEYKCPEVVTENFFQELVPPDKQATYQR